MKKSIIALIFLGSFAFASASIDTNLKYRQSGPDVLELQDFLYSKGFLTTSPTGFFGLMTLSAVKAYQTSIGVSSTGYVGILTRTAVNNELASHIASSTQAEIAETGTTTPIVNTPVQPSVTPQTTPVASSPVSTGSAPQYSVTVPATVTPHCTLAVIEQNVAGDVVAQASWTSTSDAGSLEVNLAGKNKAYVPLSGKSGMVNSFSALLLYGRTHSDLNGTGEHNHFTATFNDGSTCSAQL